MPQAQFQGGSYVRVPGGGALDLTSGLSVQAWIWPTLPTRSGGQAIVACWSEPQQRGWVLGLDDAGHLCLDLGFGAEKKRLTHVGEALQRWRWAFVAATYDPTTGTACLYQASAEPHTARDLLRSEVQLDASRRLGSINWLGSLGWNRYHNNVARVTENVLRRFLAD